MDTFRTVTQVAKELGVGPQRVRDLIHAGRLPFERFGNMMLIRSSDIDLVRVRKVGRPGWQMKKSTEASK